MAVWEKIEIKKEVYDRLAAKKAELEKTYKRPIKWTPFIALLMRNGTCEEITALDLQETEFGVLPEIEAVSK